MAHAQDVAGSEGTVSDVGRVDTIPPLTQFTSHMVGEVAQGIALMAGNVDDGLSGATGSKISLNDGITWETRALDTDGYLVIYLVFQRSGKWSIHLTNARH